MTGMTQLCTSDNFQRAWRWLQSSPDASYKSYFRDLYGIYSIADKDLIEKLRKNVRMGLYEPSSATKIFTPKKSGILRPYSLLDVEDQIVYQAAANVIADKLINKVKGRYYREVFGNLYAGKSSIWFYRKWSKGYLSFNKAAREAFNDGYVYLAEFDLTACYDSIDHQVLKHFLMELGCDEDFVINFVGWLEKWTATDRGFYHNHGIPQGPLSSGIISEVVLKYFDERRIKNGNLKYFRYVDDIRIFAKTENELRRALVQLDLLSKDVGLFPQSSKISLRKVVDIESELKTISNPIEEVTRYEPVDNKKLLIRICELTPKYQIRDVTRFKYLLSQAVPNAKLTERLWKIYDHHPEIYVSFTRYLQRYKKFPRKVEERVLQEIRDHKLYDAVVAAFIEAANGRVVGRSGINAISVVKMRWKPTVNLPDLQASAASWLIKHDSFSFKSCETAVYRSRSWWARAYITLKLNDSVIGRPSLQVLANRQIRSDCKTTALAGAKIINSFTLDVVKPFQDLNPVSAIVLKELGFILRAPNAQCRIQSNLDRMFGKTPDLNWKSLFKGNHQKAERQIISCRSYGVTNINAWINSLDVFMDRVLEALFVKDGAIGAYKLGKIGNALNVNSRFAKSYPHTHSLVKITHELRLESDLSHAVVKATGQPTRPLKHKDKKSVQKYFVPALNELKTKLNI